MADTLFGRYPSSATIQINCTEVCGTKAACEPSTTTLESLLLPFLKSTAGTLETVLRSFALGFGARMIKFAIVDREEDLTQIRERMLKSAVVGLSVASVVVGVSLVVPSGYRVNWLAYQ